jgi:hypothetical protein
MASTVTSSAGRRQCSQVLEPFSTKSPEPAVLLGDPPRGVSRRVVGLSRRSLDLEDERTCRCSLHRAPQPSARRLAMRARRSRRAIPVCTLLAVRTMTMSVPTALAADAPPSFHSGPWPIHDGRNHQPTESELRSLHLQDVTPDQMRQIDRLYDQLLADKVRKF